MITTTMETNPRNSEGEQSSPVRAQLLIAVLKGIIAGDLKLCDFEKDHQEDRHSLAGWLQVFYLQERGWYYDPEWEKLYKVGSNKHDPIMYPYDAQWAAVLAIGINSTETRLLFEENLVRTTMHEKLHMALLLEKGFRFDFYDAPDDAKLERPDSYMFFTYGGVNERYDYRAKRRNEYFTTLYKRFFGIDVV